MGICEATELELLRAFGGKGAFWTHQQLLREIYPWIVTPKNVCGTSSTFAGVTEVTVPGKYTLTCSLSPAR